MKRWLNNIPASDLEGINRIYIVGLQNSERYLGWYVPHLASVTIVWNRFQSHFNPLAWPALWLQELVLYHEIGHHVLKHEGGGYDQEKEDAADNYAVKIFFKKRPRLFILVRSIVRTVKWINRLFEKKDTP